MTPPHVHIPAVLLQIRPPGPSQQPCFSQQPGTMPAFP